MAKTAAILEAFRRITVSIPLLQRGLGLDPTGSAGGGGFEGKGPENVLKSMETGFMAGSYGR
jgi:hypothetical protein